MNFYSDSVEKLLYVLPKEEHDIDKIKEILKKHREVSFVSFVAMDFSGNGTDEKIPVETFLSNIESMLKNGIQTDGSGVVLQKIATLEDAKVVIIPDIDAYWYVDYNFTSLDDTGEIPVGTLRIPSFLSHNNKYVCSRSILKHAIERIKKETFDFMYHHPSILRELNITHASIEDVYLTLATELEFWVSTPDDIVDEEKLSASQELKEQYWKHTDGEVRSALEDVLTVMDLYGFEPEMGHKEVGGVTSKISVNGKSEHVMEQLEVDWKYDNPMDTADKEHFIRHLIKDIFHLHKLEVTFRAKPVEGVAGSGKHLHIGVGLNLKDKNKVNLYSYNGNEKHYMTSYGYGALMGILKNYEVINPFIAWTNDSINRLKPDFDDPLGESTGAGVIFATTGGVIEATVRTAYNMITGSDLKAEDIEFKDLRGFDGIKEAVINIDGFDKELKIAVAHGLGNARKLLEDIRNGIKEYDAIEIMACPGGCIGGAGQPYHHGNIDILKQRADAIYAEDRNKEKRMSYENEKVQELYKNFLGEPGSEIAHKLLHTEYFSRPRN